MKIKETNVTYICYIYIYIFEQKYIYSKCGLIFTAPFSINMRYYWASGPCGPQVKV